MNFSDAFKETLFRFDLKGAEIAARSGLTTAQVSQFRQGKNIRTDSLEKVLAALSPDARRFMLDLVAEGDQLPLPEKSPKESSSAAEESEEG